MKESKESNEEQENYNNKNRLMQEIVAKNTIAACDAMVNGRFMAGYWQFTNSFNNKISEGYICSDS